MPAHPDAAAIDALLRTELSCAVDYPFDEFTRVYRAAGKVVALSRDGAVPATITLKGHPLDNAQLCSDFAAITPGYHMNKKHWVTVVIDGSVPLGLLEEMAAASHDLILASLTRAQRAAWLAEK